MVSPRIESQFISIRPGNLSKHRTGLEIAIIRLLLLKDLIELGDTGIPGRFAKQSIHFDSSNDPHY